MFMVEVQKVAPYERPALTKAFLFPLDKNPARLPVKNYPLYFLVDRDQ